MLSGQRSPQRTSCETAAVSHLPAMPSSQSTLIAVSPEKSVTNSGNATAPAEPATAEEQQQLFLIWSSQDKTYKLWGGKREMMTQPVAIFAATALYVTKSSLALKHGECAFYFSLYVSSRSRQVLAGRNYSITVLVINFFPFFHFFLASVFLFYYQIPVDIYPFNP